MIYDPATGRQSPYPSHAAQWRERHGETAWLFNPWSGSRRDARDVGSDIFGHLIIPEGERVFALRTTAPDSRDALKTASESDKQSAVALPDTTGDEQQK